MARKTLALVLAAAVFAALCPSTVVAQASNADKIASALGAAPASVAKDATVMDWPDASGKMAVLRQGTNGWTCMPSEPKTQYIVSDAMCVDANFMDLISALGAGKPPAVKGIGYAYMLNNDDWESNVNPGAKAPTPTNEWHHVLGHVMVVYPDKAQWAGLPTHPSTTGPYVMWPDTPYAHVMWPMK